MASRLQAVIWPWVVATLTLTNVYVLLSGLSPCPAVYLENREEDMEDKIRGIVLERVNQELKSLQEENKKKLKMQSKQAHHLGAMSESPNQTVPFERKDLISSEGNLNLSLKDIDGFTILRKAISLEDVLPLRKWNPEEEVLTFIHIQKAGGSSFQSALMRSKVTQDCTVKCVANAKGLMSFKTRAACPNIKPAVCNKHFDWTVVTEGEQNGFQMAPLILFRDPVMRAVSHFHFFQTLTLARGHKMQCQNVTEYLADRDSMLDTRHLWFDGSGGSAYLTETNCDVQVIESLSDLEKHRREQQRLNWTYMLNTAIDNLHKCLWFGILEDVEKSMEMLRMMSETQTLTLSRRGSSDEET